MSSDSSSTAIYTSSTLYISIEQPTTLSTIISTPTLTISQAFTSTNTAEAKQTLSSASMAQSSALPPDPTPRAMSIDSPSQVNRERIIILALVCVVIFAIVAFIAAYCYRRSKKICVKKHQDLEEGKNEVEAARAMWPADHTLKDGYSSWGAASERTIHIQLERETPAPFLDAPVTPIATEEGIVPHPLFHPGIQRSRTLPYSRPKVPISRLAMSYPRMRNGQISYLDPRSSHSFERYRPDVPMTPFNTMQTRRPQTPELALSVPVRRTIPNHTTRREVHSIWSSGSSEGTPSSPSVYATPSQATNRDPLNLLYPTPVAKDYTKFPSSPPQSPPLSNLTHSGRGDSPTIRPGTSACPLFHLDNLICPPSPQSLPRSPSPIYNPETLSRSRSSPSLRSQAREQRRGSYECALAAQLEIREEPIFKIERWLHGSTGTASAFGSFIAESENGDDFTPPPIREPESETEEVLEYEETKNAIQKNEEMDAAAQEEKWNGERRISISPIRGMRSSASRPKSVRSIQKGDGIGTAL